MIEILVAISIILVLLAIGVVGYRSMDAKASRDGTRTAMNNAMNLVAEYERSAPFASIPGMPGGVGSPGDVSSGNNANRYGTALADTQAVIIRLRSVPKNQTFMAQVPPKSLMGEALPSGAAVPSTTGGVPLVLTSDRKLNPPVFLDGWNNPILLVGRAGLTGVQVNGTSVTITSPDGRPFWASAGADGNFSGGDDNVYSFEK